jgi:hypothetical protein
MNPQPPTFAHFNSSDRLTAAIRSASDFARVHVARRPAPRALIACALACLLSVGASASGVARKAAPRARGAKPPAAKAAGTTARGDDKTAAAQPSPSPSPSQPPAPTPSPIEIESYEASPYPADDGLKRYALVVKRKDGDGSFFGTDPSLISLSLTPAGAADITIRRVTSTRIEADFRAPADYKVKDVGVTVYNASDRQLVAASSDVTKKPADASQDTAKNDPSARPKPLAEDEQQPEITSTSVVFLQRAYGIGRLKIEGRNFGTYEAPPISAENYLLCFEPLARQALIDALSGLPDNTRNVRMKLDDERCDGLRNNESREKWDEWRAKVEPVIKVALVPRNTDLRIEQTKVLYADDKLIDVYFEFNRYYKYSEPLRLASTTVTVQKKIEQAPEKKPQAAGGQSQSAAARGLAGASVIDAVVGGGAGADDVKPPARPQPLTSREGMKTFIATREVGTKQDENLEYRYTVLDTASAKTLFGSGVANNFYAIQLSVTNKGDKKVAIPLASIQAEIEWAEGLESEDDAESANLVKASANAKVSNAPPPMPKKNGEAAKQKGGYIYFEEGPATLAPLPLAAVTAFFTGDEKAKGPKAHLFNAFDGAATLGASLIPFFGPGFKDAHVAFTGGFVPGFHKFIGDLSGEQLENLTANSWQSVEVVAAKGGSVDKFVFIQRGDQDFAVGIGEKIRKRIKDIEGIEVVGFEVIESEAKRATLAGEQ